MDPIKAEKLQALKKYRKNQVFNYNLILHLLAGIACSIVFSYVFWFPYCLYSSMKHFFLISFPCAWSSFLNPKCLFVVVNVIVIFLVGESRLVGTSSSSAAPDIYNEYIERRRSLRRGNPVISTPQEKIKTMQEDEKEAAVKVVNVAEEKKVKEEDGELVDYQVKEVMKLAETEEKEVITAEEAKQVKQEETVVQGRSGILEDEEEGCEDQKERDILKKKLNCQLRN